MTVFSQGRRVGGMNAGLLLLPADGGLRAERRTHPFAGEPFGAHVPDRLSHLPEEVARSVAEACDANFGLAGTPLRRG